MIVVHESRRPIHDRQINVPGGHRSFVKVLWNSTWFRNARPSRLVEPECLRYQSRLAERQVDLQNSYQTFPSDFEYA